ncbi:hypothetical protein AAT19DRAFT_14528 [Rhodotorula toruloides]|uniref:Small EDRK-rich factor-like N-terminal domain-containing protein n=1 Tax=Rhodotorula toruloides TaxID=5286 RepID=A0A2T0A836_RHOTO|nr:hypothetical protein AAT19DRAFT_14528 [Rhodotorula toruloides]
MARGNQRDKVKRSFRSSPSLPFVLLLDLAAAFRSFGRADTSLSLSTVLSVVHRRAKRFVTLPSLHSLRSEPSLVLRTPFSFPISTLTSTFFASQAQKKAADAQKGKRNDDGKSFKARQEADAAIMRQKQEAAAAKKAADGAKAK